MILCCKQKQIKDMRKFHIICAMLKDSRGIGFENGLPWKQLSTDMAYFKKLTSETQDPNKRNALIMGRNTWESIPKKFRPLPDRGNIILSRKWNHSKVLEICKEHAQTFERYPKTWVDVNPNLEDCLKNLAKVEQDVENVFIIGGSQLYDYVLTNKTLAKWVDKIHLTVVDTTCECDTYFPEIPNHFRLLKNTETKDEKTGISLDFQVYQNSYDPMSQEHQYLGLLRNILDNGFDKPDRTGTGVVSMFAQHLRFSIRDWTLPLFTTKKMFVRGVIEELLFFIRGNVDNDRLRALKVGIWNGNTTREYLDSIGLTDIETNSLGKAYGFQWRFWGAPYMGKDADYKQYAKFHPNQVHDQLATCLRQIKENPTSRRIIMSAWNVGDLHRMALPPCHMLYQFYINTATNELSCVMTQRSADVFLGLPFNVASTALLCMVMSKASGLNPGEIVVNIGDAHIYKNHLDQVKTQLTRDCYRFPKMHIDVDINTVEDMEKMEYCNFILQDYKSHPNIKAKMAV